MKQKPFFYLLLFFTLLNLAACNAVGSVEPEIEPTGQTDVETEAPMAACVEAEAGTRQLIDATHGICLHYPENYEVFANDDGGFTLYVDSLLNTEAPIASITFEQANGRPVEEFLSQYMPDVDFSAVRLQTVDLGGETGLILDNLPGQDINRRVIAIHDGLVINMMVARIGEEYGEVGQQAEALYQTVTESFQFIAVVPGAPLLANGAIIDSDSPANDGGIEIVPAFDGTLAYVQDKNLYIQQPNGESVTIETCPQDAYCMIQYLKWAPDGQHLLYYYYDGTNDSLRITDPMGQVQVVTDDSVYVLPGDWSLDGQAIVFLRPTEVHIEGTETTFPVHVHEVWTAALDDSGIVQEAQLVGNTARMEDGCGGGGRSPSEVLYENEGGTAYGYLMGVMEWTASDILLYTSNCTNVGINRFDMNSATDLPPFEAMLRNLILDETGRHWYAVTSPTDGGSPQIATGTPEETAVTTIPTSNPVELVYYGDHTHKLYYTTREFIENKEIPDLGAYFQFYRATLWQINNDGSDEALLWQAGDQAYAQVSEVANGDILFVLVESDRPLYEALQEGTATMDDMGEFAPQRHIMRLSSGGEPQLLISNAGQPEVAP